MRHKNGFTGNARGTRESRWRAVLLGTGGGDADWSQAIAAGIGMAGPIIAGAASGRASAAFAACAGSLMLGSVAGAPSARAHLREIGLVLLPAIAAAVVASLLGGHGLGEDAIAVFLAALVSLAGGMSRAGAIAAGRFVLFLLVAIGVAENVAGRLALVVLVGAGAAWTAVASFVCGAVARAMGHARAVAEEPARAIGAAQRIARWRGTLRTLAGWQYTLRLAFGLAAAAIAGWMWPGHHLHWVAITVALLTERQPEPLPVRTLQRGLGTLAGVIVAAVVFAAPLPVAALALAMGILAAARPLLRSRHYLAYTTINTPLILAILDAGEPPSIAVLVDRLVATVIGIAIVLAGNLVFHRLAANGIGPDAGARR